MTRFVACPRYTSLLVFSLAAVATGVLGGCAMPNSSNPTLSITRAVVRDDRAILDMELDNPSDMDVTVDAIEWALQYGPLPTAQGAWTLGVPLASKESYSFSKEVRFTSPPLDPTADTIELSGTLKMSTKGSSGEMSLKGAAFVTSTRVQR